MNVNNIYRYGVRAFEFVPVGEAIQVQEATKTQGGGTFSLSTQDRSLLHLVGLFCLISRSLLPYK